MTVQPPNPNRTTIPTLMLVTDVPFWLDRRGSSERIAQMLKYLVTFCDVTICFIGELSVSQWNQGLRDTNVKWCGPGLPGRAMRTAVGWVDRLTKEHRATNAPRPYAGGSHQSVSLIDFESDVIADYVADQVMSMDADVVLLEYVALSYLCNRLRNPGGPLLVIDTHDVMHARSRELEAVGEKNWLNISLQQEMDALSSADAVLAIQEREAALLRNHLPEHSICLVKHAAELRRKESKQKRPNEFAIGFVGSVGIANTKSIEFFLKECWPAILRQSNPNPILRIGGGLQKNDLDPLLNLDNVEFVGRFDDSNQFYASIDVAINPAIIASGLKIKSIDAIAHATPLVSTEAGLAGLESSIGHCSVQSNDWSQFTDSLVSIANSPERLAELTDNCATYVESQLNPNTVYAELRELIMKSVEVRS